jgi:hypothetical protein
MMNDDVHLCLSRLRPHIKLARAALTGGVAIAHHAAARGRQRPHEPGAVRGDVDLVAMRADAVAPSVVGPFIVSHFHRPQPEYAKFLIQLVDVASRLRVDVFSCDDNVWDDATKDVVAGGFRVLAPERILEHKLAILAQASAERPVDEKHYRDARLLAALCACEIPERAPDVFASTVYGHDLTTRCARCDASRDARFPLAPKQHVYGLLGYV